MLPFRLKAPTAAVLPGGGMPGNSLIGPEGIQQAGDFTEMSDEEMAAVVGDRLAGTLDCYLLWPSDRSSL